MDISVDESESIGSNDTTENDSLHDDFTQKLPVTQSEISQDQAQNRAYVSIFSNLPSGEVAVYEHDRNTLVDEDRGRLSEKSPSNEVNISPLTRPPGVYTKDGRQVGSLQTTSLSPSMKTLLTPTSPTANLQIKERVNVNPSPPTANLQIMERVSEGRRRESGSVYNRDRKCDEGELSDRPFGMEDLQSAGTGRIRGSDDNQGRTLSSQLSRSSKHNSPSYRGSPPTRVQRHTAESGRNTTGTINLSNDFEPETVGENPRVRTTWLDGKFVKSNSSPIKDRSAEGTKNIIAVSNFSELEEAYDQENEEGSLVSDEETPMERGLQLPTNEDRMFKIIKAVELALKYAEEQGAKVNNEIREDVLDSVMSNASLMGYCALDPKLRSQVRISQSDLVAYSLPVILNKVEKAMSCGNSTRNTSYDTSDLRRIVSEVITMSNYMETTLEMIYQVGKSTEMMLQHEGVLDNLTNPKKYVNKKNKWIPKEKISDIADWYIQYHGMLAELKFFHDGMLEASDPMKKFTERYPGPSIQIAHSDFDNFKFSGRAYRTVNDSNGENIINSPIKVVKTKTTELVQSPSRNYLDMKTEEKGYENCGQQQKFGKNQTPSIYSLTKGSKELERANQRYGESVSSNSLEMLSEDETVITQDFQETFGWNQALEYAKSNFGPIKRLNLPGHQMLDILGKCRSQNSQLRMGVGNESKCMETFPKVAAKIKPQKIEGAINMGIWLRGIVSETENQYWPIWMRIQFLKETGALAIGVEDKVRERIKLSFGTPDDFLLSPDQEPYDPTHNKNDDRYWLCIWVESLCWLFKQFYQPIEDDAILREVESRIRSGINFNIGNEQSEAIFQVHHQLKLIFELVKQSMSGLSETPQLIVSRLLTILKTEKGPVGDMVAKAITRQIRRAVNDPHQFFKSNTFRLSDAELDQIKSKGVSCLNVNHYTIITTTLLDSAKSGESLFLIESYSDIQKYTESGSRPKTKKIKEKEEVYYDDEEDENDDQEMETIVLKKKKTKPKAMSTRTTSDEDLPEISIKALGVSTDINIPYKDRWTVPGVTQRCSICGMLHKPGQGLPAGECLFFAPRGGVDNSPQIKGRNMLAHEGVLYKGYNKTSIGFKFQHELKDFGFPKLGITDKREIEKIMSDLNMGAKIIGSKESESKAMTTIQWEEEKKPPKSVLKGSQEKVTVSGSSEDLQEESENED
jgi:hypothetical protein